MVAIKGFVNKQYRQWLDRRIPKNKSLTLNQRRLFIFPSLQGLYFFIVILLILLAAINYQNNLVYGVAFFLFSLFNTAICFTYLNLSGLMLKAGRSEPVFAGDFAEFEVHLGSNSHKSHHRIFFQFPDEMYKEVDVVEGGEEDVLLHCKATRRGYFVPPRLMLKSYYPLGIIRCWSWVDLDLQTLVYPKPIKLDPLPGYNASVDQGQVSAFKGGDDFSGFKNYSPGEPLRDVNWKAYAKGQGLVSKVHTSFVEKTHWVDDELLLHIGLEERLSKMCYWALELHKSDQAFGLRLAGRVIEPAIGEKHLHLVLKQLALFAGSVDG